MRLPELLDRTGLSRAEIDRLEKRGIFPRRRLVGERAIGWLEHEVDAFIRSRPQVGA
jgi:prophage regulatory protein